jgi:hypothetical protein
MDLLSVEVLYVNRVNKSPKFSNAAISEPKLDQSFECLSKAPWGPMDQN